MAELGLVGDGPNSYQVFQTWSYQSLMVQELSLFLVRKFKRSMKDLTPYLVLNQIWLGGTPNQTSLARTFMNKVKLHDLEKVFEPLFYYWRTRRQSKESFGNFSNRMVRTEVIYTKTFLLFVEVMFL